MMGWLMFVAGVVGFIVNVAMAVSPENGEKRFWSILAAIGFLVVAVVVGALKFN